MENESHLQSALRRWKSADEFYQERDNRTVLAVGDSALYSEREIEIHVDVQVAHCRTIQMMVLIAANLTARWARCIRVFVPEVNLDQGLRRDQDQSLGDRIVAEMTAADPFGDFQLRNPIRSATRTAGNPLRLLIGSFDRNSDIDQNDYLITACEWSVFGRRGKAFEAGEQREATVAAAGLAAALGAADLFKRAIGHPPQHWLLDFSWCTWSHRITDGGLPISQAPAVSQTLDLGKTLLAGVGAIGSAFVYLADMMNLSGELVLLDRDSVETSNLNRSPLFTTVHATAGIRKTKVVLDYLSRQDIAGRAVNGEWRDHGEELAKEPFDVWISLTNENGAWAEVPFLLPPVVLQATTTSGWGMGAGRHIPRLDDCTLCRLPRPEAEFRGLCSEGNISAEETTPPVRAALPFLSTGAAALLLAEYLKLKTGLDDSSTNDVSADLRYGLPAVISIRRKQS